MAIQIIEWDHKEQPDMTRIAAAVWEVSGHRCDIREVYTGGDSYAVVVNDQAFTTAQAQEEFDRTADER